MPRLFRFSRGLTLAGMLVLSSAAALAEDEAAPALPPPPLAPPALSDTKTIGDWSLEVFKMSGQEGAFCVVSRTYEDGERLGFILGSRGRGVLYGKPDLSVREGTKFDFGFSVDGRPPLGLPGQPYDPNTIMTTAQAGADGHTMLEVFTLGKEAVIGSNQLKFRTGPLSLKGSGEAVAGLNECGKENGIQDQVAALPPPATPAKPAAPSPGAAVPRSTFDEGGGGGRADGGLGDIALPGEAPGAPAPAPAAPVAPPAPGAEAAAVTPPPAVAAPPAAAPAAPASPADKAIQDAISAEAKKRKAGVGYAVAMPKDVTGDQKDDIVLLFVLLEGKDRKGYVTVLKTTGVNKFTQTNTLALGGVPTNDPPVFNEGSMVISLVTRDPAKTREVEVLITAKGLKLK